MKEQKTLLIVKGDTKHPLAAIDAYFPFFRWRRTVEHSDYRMETIVKPDLETLLLRLAAVDAVIFYGHGHPGKILLGKDSLDTEALKRLRALRSRDFDFVHIASCDTLSDAEFVSAWLELTPRLSGYRAKTYDLRKPFHIPSPERYSR